MPGRRQDPIDVAALAGALAERARDAAYVAVGLGVLGVQRVQVARRRMARGTGSLDEVLGRMGAELGRLGPQAGRTGPEAARRAPEPALGARQLGEWLDGTVDLVSSSLRPFEEQLPDPARELADRARSQLHAIARLLQDSPGA